jgi:hypothetical protein
LTRREIPGGSFLGDVMNPLDPVLTDKMLTNTSLGLIVLIFVWRLPTIVTLISQMVEMTFKYRKEIAEIMEKQSNTFASTLDKITEKFEAHDLKLESLDNTVKNLCMNIEANQQAIKAVLDEIKGGKNEKRPGNEGHTV